VSVRESGGTVAWTPRASHADPRVIRVLVGARGARDLCGERRMSAAFRTGRRRVTAAA
jgi:hypothetical protein